jgi:uncharacterized protein (DUF58 family)
VDLKFSGLDLPPEQRARLAGIAFRTRSPAPGGPLGRQLSRSRGSGIEFAQYRGYTPGDAPRQIDWKLFARSDRLFVREAERDSPLSLVLVVDASASMGQADQARPDWTRLHAARRLTACAIEIAMREDERFGLIILGNGAASFIPPAAGRAQRDRCFAALAGLKTGGVWPPRQTLETLSARIEHGALVLLLSDLFDPAAVTLLERLAAAGREASALRILTAEERDFPFRGSFLFRDPESGETRESDAQSVRAGFLQRFELARRSLAAQLRMAGVGLAEHWLDQPEDAALRALFPASGSRRA